MTGCFIFQMFSGHCFERMTIHYRFDLHSHYSAGGIMNIVLGGDEIAENRTDICWLVSAL